MLSRRRFDLLVLAAAVVGAFWLTAGMWVDPSGRAIGVNSGDQALFEWLLSYAAHTLVSAEDPFYTHLLNAPDGANIAVNTSATVFGWVFAPVTFTLGPAVTFLIILTGNLIATAYAWYWLISRQLGVSQVGAAIGGLIAGFAPAIVSHANAHLNWTAQWLSVLIVWAVLRLRGGYPWRRGVVLGVLIAAGFSIAAEGLFFTALACGVFLTVWAVRMRAEARAAAGRFLRGLGVAAGTAAVLLVYPLWMHFFGPQRYHGIGFDQRVHSEDLLAFGAYPERSLAGITGLRTHLAPNPTEETTFFGIPLLVLTVLCGVLGWRVARGDRARRALLLALGVTALVFAVLALGPRLKVAGDITSIPLPYAVLAHLPMFDAALPARFALVVTPIVGMLLALGFDAARLPRWHGAFVAGLVIALVPLVPLPLLTRERPPVPEFFTSGAWKSYVDDGGTVVPVPLPSDLLPDGQRWQAAVLAQPGGPEFAIPAGFFLGPGPDGRSQIGPIPRPTHELLFAAAKLGIVPPVGAAERAQAREDLRYWRAQMIVLDDQIEGAHWPVHYDAVMETATLLFGPPTRVGDVWIWRVTT